MFAEFGLSKKLVSDADMNFVSEQFKKFCSCLYIDQVMTSSLHHQINRQVEASITLVKCTITKGRQANNDVLLALLQLRATPGSADLPSPAIRLRNRPIRALLLQIGREPINVNNDDEYYEALISRPEASTKNNETHKISPLFSAASKVAVQMEVEGSWLYSVIIEGNSEYH